MEKFTMKSLLMKLKNKLLSIFHQNNQTLKGSKIEIFEGTSEDLKRPINLNKYELSYLELVNLVEGGIDLPILKAKIDDKYCVLVLNPLNSSALLTYDAKNKKDLYKIELFMLLSPTTVWNKLINILSDKFLDILNKKESLQTEEITDFEKENTNDPTDKILN